MSITGWRTSVVFTRPATQSSMTSSCLATNNSTRSCTRCFIRTISWRMSDLLTRVQSRHQAKLRPCSARRAPSPTAGCSQRQEPDPSVVQSQTRSFHCSSKARQLKIGLAVMRQEQAASHPRRRGITSETSSVHYLKKGMAHFLRITCHRDPGQRAR